MAFDYEIVFKQMRERRDELHRQKAEIDRQKAEVDRRRAEVDRRKAEIEAEIKKVESGIEAFAPLVGKVPDSGSLSKFGMTDAIRAVLRDDPEKLYAPTEIRNQMSKRGYKFDQTNPMAAIHQILTRLVERELHKSVTEGKPLYGWGRKSSSGSKPLRNRK